MAVDSGGGKGFKIADAFVEVHIDDDAAKREVGGIGRKVGPEGDRAGRDIGTSVGKGIGKTLGPEADKSGRQGGDKLAQGMRLAVIRNSPLIAAAIGGALVAGAPVLLAASTTLFAGIGIVAAAQSEEVQTAWSDTWADMKKVAIAEAVPIERVLVGLADRTSLHISAMRDQIQMAFLDTAPNIEIFADGLLNAADNALPGLVRSIASGRPVVEGFASLLRDTGTGLSVLFDTLSEHADAGGESIDEIGQAVGILLPLLGELLGQGAELASDVLPLMNFGLGITLKAVQLLGPALPVIVQGVAALKIAQAAGGWLGSASTSATKLAQNLAFASYNGGAFAGTAGRLSSAVSGAAGATATLGQQTGALTAIIGGALAMWEMANAQGDEWSRMLLEGGKNAATARAQMSDFGTAMQETNEGFGGFITNLVGLGAPFETTAVAMDRAEQQTKDYLASLDPIARSAYDAQVAEKDLAFAIAEHGAGSDQAKDAQNRYKAATDENARAQADLERALDGVTGAMLEQADQALASIDSDFALSRSKIAVEEAQGRLNDLLKEGKYTSEELQAAQLDVTESTYRSAQAFGQYQADISGASKDSAEYARIVQEQTLAQLIRLRDVAGPEIAGALDIQIDRLQAAGITLGATSASAGNAASQFDNMRLKILSVPNSKSVIVSSTTPEQIRLLQDLGFRVEHLPNGTVQVTALTAAAENAINFVARPRTVLVNVLSAYGLGAEGGSTEDIFAGAQRFDGGGAVRGRGGPRDDLVPAVSPYGLARLGAGEHVLDGDDVGLMGGQSGVYRFRDLLNRGRIDVPGMIADAAGGAGGGRSIVVQHLSVNVTGTFDLRDPGAARKVAVQLAPAVRDALVEEEAKYR